MSDPTAITATCTPDDDGNGPKIWMDEIGMFVLFADWVGPPIAVGETIQIELAKAGTTAENAALRARVKKLEALKTCLLNENMEGADCNRKLRARVKELEKAVEQPLANLGGGVWSEPADVVEIEQRLFEIADAVPDEDMAKLPENLSERFEEHLASAEEKAREWEEMYEFQTEQLADLDNATRALMEKNRTLKRRIIALKEQAVPKVCYDALRKD